MIKTRSIFYYGYTVDSLSNTLRIDEGSGDIDISIPLGSYTLTDYVVAVSAAINNETTQEYTVSVDRDSRNITISADSNFELKVADIFPLNSGFPIMGFKEVVNLSGSSSYTSDSASGDYYAPQFWLMDYLPFGNSNKYIDGAINETANGLEEVVSFGLVRFMECDIKFITNTEMPFGAPIENNTTALEDTRRFLSYLITKGDLEFMEDRDDRSSFYECRLSKTSSDSKGLGFTLREPRKDGFYETGKLTFREII